MADKTIYLDEELHTRLKAAGAAGKKGLAEFTAEVIELGLEVLAEREANDE